MALWLNRAGQGLLPD